jgi:membrane protease YdiL (CAAX protease family)
LKTSTLQGVVGSSPTPSATKYMDIFLDFSQKVRLLTSSIKPVWTILLVPVWQEVVFRYLPYTFWYLQTNEFLFVGIVSSFVFALIHWYFGWGFVIAAFLAGLVYWFVMVEHGLIAAIAVHAFVNLVDVTFNIRQALSSWFS